MKHLYNYLAVITAIMFTHAGWVGMANSPVLDRLGVTGLCAAMTLTLLVEFIENWPSSTTKAE